jgi:hypothetical protein
MKVITKIFKKKLSRNKDVDAYLNLSSDKRVQFIDNLKSSGRDFTVQLMSSEMKEAGLLTESKLLNDSLKKTI